MQHVPRHLKQSVFPEPNENRINFNSKKKRPLENENDSFNVNKKHLHSKKEVPANQGRRILGDLSNKHAASQNPMVPGLKKLKESSVTSRSFVAPSKPSGPIDDYLVKPTSQNKAPIDEDGDWDMNGIDQLNIQEIHSVDEMSMCEETIIQIESVIGELPALQDLSITSLDEEDLPDPQSASEYIHEIFEWCRKTEVDAVPGAYLEGRRISPSMRTVLVDWLIDVFINFSLRPETIFLCVQILDRFIAQKSISRSKLQLAGSCALLIASKYEDVYAPEINDLIFVSKNSFTENQVKSMEEFICKTLDFRFSLPSCFTFLQRFLKAALNRADLNIDYDREEEQGTILIESLYFCLLSLLSYECLEYKPSMIAASAMYLTFCRLELNWTFDLEKYTGYSEKDVKECASHIYTIYRKDRDIQKSQNPNSNVSIPSEHYASNNLEELASKVLS